ncbi:hypothetical protein D9757_009692 [Collybiopsis confluens]|uniref:Uncharacterized protein n=1 Tax=Collybiopsis confluens TaxID=2823264 RepID=A0A8H5M143_9AGAR|nr:hypothetical protein D9757_009692 [Collybiopsis confluens]
MIGFRCTQKVKTFIWDANAAFTTILNNPTAFGFKDATSFGDASNLFWINNLHTTSAANVFWAQGVAQTLAGTVF